MIEKKLTEGLIVIECSVHKASTENVTKLNEHFQKQKLPTLEMQFAKSGPDHQPVFICETKFENRVYQASAQTKKEAEKKVRSYIWASCIGNDQVQKDKEKEIWAPAKVLEKQAQKPSFKVQVADYETFRRGLKNYILEEASNDQRPILMIDLTTLDYSCFENDEIFEACKSQFSKIIILTSKKVLEWKDSFVIIIKEDINQLVQEYITRIIYFTLDYCEDKQLTLLAMRQYSLLITAASRAGQRIMILPSLEHIL